MGTTGTHGGDIWDQEELGTRREDIWGPWGLGGTWGHMEGTLGTIRTHGGDIGDHGDIRDHRDT